MAEQSLHWYHRLYVGIQYLLPHHLLSALMFRVTRVQCRPLKNLLIRTFVNLFRVDMTEAQKREPSDYASFNDFFTRSLNPGARPISPQTESVVCPADGVLSQIGTVGNGRIFQAKGHDYSLLELLGGNRAWAQRLDGGTFATIYLSPRDYHRVHMPVGGTLREMIHVPGRLFSVNPVTTSLVPRLFSRNERVICLFEGDAGPIALIFVGAIFVGSVETVWAGPITPTGAHKPSRVYDAEAAVHLDKGTEMGRFNMGSTVILLFGPGKIEWPPELKPGDSVHMGQGIGRICHLDPSTADRDRLSPRD